MRADFGRQAEQREAFGKRCNILRLAERHGVAVALLETIGARRCTFHHLDIVVAVVQSVPRQQFTDRSRDAAALVGKAETLALEVGETLDAGLGDQAVNRVVELRRDGHRIRSGQHLADQKRRGNVGDIDSAIMQRVDHLVGAAGQRHDDFEVEAFAAKKALALRHDNRQRENTAQRRIGLAVTQFERLGLGLRAKHRGQQQSQDGTPHQGDRCSVHSISTGPFSVPGGVRRLMPVCL